MAEAEKWDASCRMHTQSNMRMSFVYSLSLSLFLSLALPVSMSSDEGGELLWQLVQEQMNKNT